MLQQSGLAVTWVRFRWCLLDVQAAPDDLSDLHFFFRSPRRKEEDYLLTTSIRTHASPGIRRWWLCTIKYNDIVVLEPPARIFLEDTAQKANCAHDGSNDERRGQHEQCDEHLGVDHDRPMTPRDA